MDNRPIDYEPISLADENAMLRNARDWWARIAIYGWATAAALFIAIIAAMAAF